MIILNLALRLELDTQWASNKCSMSHPSAKGVNAKFFDERAMDSAREEIVVEQPCIFVVG